MPTLQVCFDEQRDKGRRPEILEDSVEVLKTLIILCGTPTFFTTYAIIDGWEPSARLQQQSENPLDRWILSACEALVREVTEAWDQYETQRGCSAIVSFLDSLNNWYIRRSRRRFWRSESDADKGSAYATLYKVLMKLIHIAAPVIPFTTEAIYRNLKTPMMPESIHLCDFPVYDGNMRDLDLEATMSVAVKASLSAARCVPPTQDQTAFETVILVNARTSAPS